MSTLTTICRDNEVVLSFDNDGDLQIETDVVTIWWPRKEIPTLLAWLVAEWGR